MTTRRDHGGRTSRGITQREYDAWCAEHNWASMESVVRQPAVGTDI
ncbi:glycosyl hydrolase 108 family protein [Bradyrhizobium sp. Cp5.3]|nr:glycosyl hydrolase 108 family protein [Bradyrhizobium sp. Cp5.3]